MLDRARLLELGDVRKGDSDAHLAPCGLEAEVGVSEPPAPQGGDRDPFPVHLADAMLHQASHQSLLPEFWQGRDSPDGPGGELAIANVNGRGGHGHMGGDSVGDLRDVVAIVGERVQGIGVRVEPGKATVRVTGEGDVEHSLQVIEFVFPQSSYRFHVLSLPLACSE